MPQSAPGFGFAPHLPLGRLPVVEPSADLWQRIADAHCRRIRRHRRLRRGTTLACGMAGVALAIGLLVRHGAFPPRPEAGAAIDWQARAQALELQLRSSPPNGYGPTSGGDAVRNELVRVDAALQRAYDNGAARDRVVALWKRRSELLGALLEVRRHDVEISRI